MGAIKRGACGAFVLQDFFIPGTVKETVAVFLCRSYALKVRGEGLGVKVKVSVYSF